MIETKIIGFFYILYTIFLFLIISVTSLEFWSMIPSLLLMWLVYVFYVLGSAPKKKLRNKTESFTVTSWLENQPNYIFVMLSIIAIVFSYLVVRFYTGLTFQTVIYNIKDGISNYAQYQKHFAENQISEFSLSKLPFIFMMAFVKFNLFYGSLSLTLNCNKIQSLGFFKIVYLIAAACSYLYIGLARGTNFEMFEFIVLIITLLLAKNKKQKIKLKKMIFSTILIFISVLVFVEVIGQRGGDGSISYYISRDVFYDENSFISKYFPSIAMLLLSVYSYFGFGFFYGMVFLNKVFFASFANTMIFTLPLFPKMFNQPSAGELMRNLVDMGARWNPDQYVFIAEFGLILLFIVSFIQGLIVRQNKSKYVGTIQANDMLVNFLIILQMLSFPTGNFIIASSSSKIIVFSLIIYKFYRVINIKSYYNKKM